ncbi:MAG: helix-turn-helix domain-containing protein [Carbonactinosporaceae bacterium]
MEGRLAGEPSTIRYGDRVLATSTSAASLLREARRRARLSQAHVARRANVSQSVISAYESGSRQPSLATLVKLIEATGCTLEVDVRRPRSRLQRLTGPVGHEVRRHRAELRSTAGRHGVSNLRVFGSVARGEDSVDSDLDLLVDVAPGVGLLGLARLQRDLEDIVQTHVDLVPADALKPWIHAEVMTDLIAL